MSGFWSLLVTVSAWGFVASLGAGGILLVWWLIRNANSESDDEDDEIYWKARAGAYRIAAGGVLSLLVFVGSCSMGMSEEGKAKEQKREEERLAENVARQEKERDEALIKGCEETLLPGLKSEDNLRAAVAQASLGIDYKSSVIKRGGGYRVYVKNKNYMPLSDSYIYSAGICDVVNGRFSVVQKLELLETPPD